MKILKNGTKELPKEKIYVMKCNVCGCKYTYQDENIEYNWIFEFNYVECPQCHYMNTYFFKKRYKGTKK